MTGSVHPSLILIAGALLLPLFKDRLKSLVLLLLPVVVFSVIFHMPEGSYWTFSLYGFDFILGRVDKLSLVFGYIFTLVTFIGCIFALKVRDDLQHVSALVYAGGALGVTFAGDFVSLYIFWELMTIASPFLILARRTKKAREVAYRYILVHIFGGLCLLAGIILRVHETGTIQFEHIGLTSLSTFLIFLGIAINGAIIPLHSWLQDAYPEATVTGAVFMSALTTKSAVYLMARTFAGTEILIYLGAAMMVIPIFYAVLANDIRRVLAYSLINQVGFMMCGIGIGTELALNGAVAHAFCHILYKALLFMSAGSVLYMTGKIRCTDLGGLYKTMPLTGLFCIIGAASISAFPLFSGFVSKSMIVSAAGHEHLVFIWFVLQFASAGVFHHAGIKVPFFMFFGHDSGLRPKEPPLNMLIAMGIAAFFCVFLAVYPSFLYNMLPYPVHYEPYTGAHVVGQLQLLMFGALAFALLILSGFYPAEIRAINLDTDWFYRKGGRLFYRFMDWALNGVNHLADKLIMKGLTRRVSQFTREGLANVLILALKPYYTLSGTAAPKRSAINAGIRSNFNNNTFPVGVLVIPVVLFLLLLAVV